MNVTSLPPRSTETDSGVTLPNREREADHRRPWYVREARIHVVVVASVYGLFGLSMFFQPLRWTRTPAYHNLFVVLPETVWAIIFTTVAAFMLISVFRYPRSRPLRLASIGFATALTLAWLSAFVIRWLTSNNTTPETWGSFAVNLYLLFRASRVLDGDIDG